jgi:hypothetical protein
VLLCELGSASPNVHFGRMDLPGRPARSVRYTRRAECGGLASEGIVFVPSRHAGRSEGYDQTAFGVVNRLRFMQDRASLTERRAAGDGIQHNHGSRQSLRPPLTTSTIIQRPRRIHRTGRNRHSRRIQILIRRDDCSPTFVVDLAAYSAEHWSGYLCASRVCVPLWVAPLTACVPRLRPALGGPVDCLRPAFAFRFGWLR